LQVVDLGADAPAADICTMAVAQDRLVGVGICATTTLERTSRRTLADAVGLLQTATGRPVLVGGAAVASAHEARRLGADGWSATIADVVAWFAELVARPGERRR
jgi:methanogenic corrinoid protein MtbC1